MGKNENKLETCIKYYTLPEQKYLNNHNFETLVSHMARDTGTQC